MKRLRLSFFLFFVLLSIPVIVLLNRSYRNLSTEAMLSYKKRAEWFFRVLNQRIYSDLSIEEERSHLDYRFLKTIPVIGGEEVTLSPLASFPPENHYEGLIGHFQVDPNGSFHSPIVPDGLLENLPVQDKYGRMAIRTKLRAIIDTLNIRQAGITRRYSENKLEHVLDRELLENSSPGSKKKLTKLLQGERLFRRRYEHSSKKGNMVFEVESDRNRQLSLPDSLRTNVQKFNENNQNMEVALDPFQATLSPKYIVFHRNVWRNGQRFMQGFVVNLPLYLASLVHNDLKISAGDHVFRVYFRLKNKAIYSMDHNNDETTHEVLQGKLPYPLNSLSMVIDSKVQKQLPGTSLLIFIGILMEFLLGGGLYGIYKVISAQIRISKKRGDFISSVTHELKTPLTAIRMYGELLSNGWVTSEDKKMHYYHLIAHESERLSRLIQNVLDLSRLEKNHWKVNITPQNPQQLLQRFMERIRPSVDHANFEIETNIEDCDTNIDLDEDACMQIFINVVENSLKFAKDAEIKKVSISLKHTPEYIVIGFRDYGPGIPSEELSRIFEDFYRIESELTRNTAGTGIGLSLVARLCKAMNVRVDARNTNPGLLIRLEFPRTIL